MIEIIYASTIEDAWRQAMYRLFEVGRIYTINKGSFEGHQRLEFYPLIVIQINYPDIACDFALEGKGIPPPVSQEYINQYMCKLLVPEKEENEDYTYGESISPQLDLVVKKFQQGPGTNQATITIGDIESIDLSDPPCLKVIDFRLTEVGYDETLNLDMILYFRSWDLWAGFPSNLIGLEQVREFVCNQLDIPIAGTIIAVSKGLHLYDYCWEIAAILNNRKLEENRYAKDN